MSEAKNYFKKPLGVTCYDSLPDTPLDMNASVKLYHDAHIHEDRTPQLITDVPLALPSPVDHFSCTEEPNANSQVSCSSNGANSGFSPTKLSRSNSCYQIVLFRDRHMVVYDSKTWYLRTCSIAPNTERLTQCPMCGQVVDPCKFSFEAQSYFRLLQNMWISHVYFSENQGRVFDSLADPLSNYSRHQALSSDDSFAKRGSAERENTMNPFVTDELRRNGNFDGNKVYDCESVLTGMCITGYYSSFFQEIRSLGSGSYGQVRLCRHYLDDVFIGEYAVKKVPVGQDRRWLQSMLREVKIREKLHHRNIVEYKHSWLEMHRTSCHLPLIPWLFVLMEYCNAGDLDHFLTTNNYVSSELRGEVKINKQISFTYMKESFIWVESEHGARKFFSDIANGLNHLHHCGILHRDLKPQNILLHCTMNNLPQRPEVTALLSDFGTSELLSDKVPERHGFTGTVEYTAPELLEIDEKGRFREDYDEKSDIWSLGIILYLMAFGRVPYFDRDPQRCRVQILKHTDPQLIIPTNANRSSDLILLIEALLQRNPRLRPSLDTILQHPHIRRRFADCNENSEVAMELSYIIGHSWNTAQPTSQDVPSTVSHKIPLPGRA